MRVEFTRSAWEDFTYWLDQDDEVAEKIIELIKDIVRDPFKGLGKPEPLRYRLKGFWSRRITREHRLVYKISGSGEDQCCFILQCRYHYD